MNKNAYIIIIALAILAIAAGAFYYYKNNVVESALTAKEKAIDSMTGAIGETNPFNVDINPLQGYKNPFGD